MENSRVHMYQYHCIHGNCSNAFCITHILISVCMSLLSFQCPCSISLFFYRHTLAHWIAYNHTFFIFKNRHTKPHNISTINISHFLRPTKIHTISIHCSKTAMTTTHIIHFPNSTFATNKPHLVHIFTVILCVCVVACIISCRHFFSFFTFCSSFFFFWVVAVVVIFIHIKIETKSAHVFKRFCTMIQERTFHFVFTIKSLWNKICSFWKVTQLQSEKKIQEKN